MVFPIFMDTSNVSIIDKALRESDLGINPIVEGNLIRLPLPQLTEERKIEYIKLAKKIGESSKVSIRNQRRDANGMLKEYLNEKEISEDDLKKGEALIQDITDQHVEKVDSLLMEKEKDLLEI